MDDLSLILDRYATPNTLNKVGAEPNSTIAPVASGYDFPHLVVLDFAQDVTLGREEVEPVPSVVGFRGMCSHALSNVTQSARAVMPWCDH